MLDSLKNILKWCRLTLMISGTVLLVWILLKGAVNYCEAMDVFDLRRIQVRGNHVVSRAEVMETMDLPLTGSVFEVDLAAVLERVESLDYVYGVRVGRKLPHTLFVDIIENQPLAYVSAPQFYILTAEGQTLPLPHGSFDLELPTISGLDSVMTPFNERTAKHHPQLTCALDVLRHLQSRYPDLYNGLSELVFDTQGEVTLYMAESPTAVHLGDEQLHERITVLGAFLRTVAGKRNILDYSYIDLR